MPVLGFHCSHEQIHPRQLLTDVRRAEEVGFDAAMSSDHFVPWSARQGHSGGVWMPVCDYRPSCRRRPANRALPRSACWPAR
jgi:alkanesulfonate monooxygenase SsuD/methylene tetrahydromethanopterin reductase-like flavin-dependent oxidoreductase (luciferase family)